MKLSRLFTAKHGFYLTSMSLAIITTAMNASEAKALISAQVKGNVAGLGLNAGPTYIEGSSNFDDEKGAGVAYSNSGVTVGASYTKKDNVGTQKGAGAGYVTNWGDKAYLGGAAKYTEFDADNGYANSKSTKAKVFTGYEFNDNLVGEIGGEYKTTTFNGYDEKDNNFNANGALIYTPDARNYSIEIRGTTDDIQNKVMAAIVIPIWGKIPKSPLSIGEHTVKKYVADSTWDDNIVKESKVTIETLPAQTVSISTSSGNIISGEGTNNIVANNAGGDVVTDLTVNSPYTLSVNQFTFNPQVGGTSETKTANILNNGQVVGTKSVKVTWQ